MEAEVFREPWLRVSDGQQADLESEASSEIGLDHELSGLRLRTIARCGVCDDVVFEVSDGTWAVVHLTWPKTRPERAPWPCTTRLWSLLALESEMDQHEH